ncbi:MAG: Regulatory protein Cgi121 [Methanoregula sp. PtaU1.Bin051]|nr:MAG: Regulatory protein Cgi121 [Methanoregula sp. PtaU1.Bin051]
MEGPAPEFEIRSAVIRISDRNSFLDALRTVMRKHHATIICFNADNMAGRRHAESAVSHALRSFSKGAPIAKTLEVEALLYAAGTRQCTEAAIFGIHHGENRAYVCCIPPDSAIWDALTALMHFVDDTWDQLDPAKIGRLKQLFAITEEEVIAADGISRLQDLVIERVALLDAYR